MIRNTLAVAESTPQLTGMGYRNAKPALHSIEVGNNAAGVHS
jgi:hypothetical protein